MGILLQFILICIIGGVAGAGIMFLLQRRDEYNILLRELDAVDGDGFMEPTMFDILKDAKVAAGLQQAWLMGYNIKTSKSGNYEIDPVFFRDKTLNNQETRTMFLACANAIYAGLILEESKEMSKKTSYQLKEEGYTVAEVQNMIISANELEEWDTKQGTIDVLLDCINKLKD